MSTPPDGGPAFPFAKHDQDELPINPGMTLRDWFAGQALVGILSNQTMIEAICRQGPPERSGADAIAGNALTIADAMIAARKETP